MKDRLKKLRSSLGLTQQEFAERIGVKRATIASYETGVNEPIDAIFTLICKEYGVSEDWLRTGKGEMFSKVLYDELDKVVAKYHLNDKASEMIKKFVELPPDERDIIIKYMESVVKAILDKESNQQKDHSSIVASYMKVNEIKFKDHLKMGLYFAEDDIDFLVSQFMNQLRSKVRSLSEKEINDYGEQYKQRLCSYQAQMNVRQH